MIPIYDLHCDLLSYLADKEGRGIYDKEPRCSYPDLLKGGVKMQTLALFARTAPDSVVKGEKQVEIFQKVLKEHPLEFCQGKSTSSQQIQVLAALENGSSFSLEHEPLDKGLKRLQTYMEKLRPLFYISLTWNEENRFGGGNESQVGLKEDGKRVLEFLDGKKVAIDLSHTSDPLAYDLINWIDKKSLNVPLMASHSNFRALSLWPRNLPEEIAKELIRRGGVIGLNLVGPFIHNTDPSVLYRHIEYALALGGEDTLCFGADFFHDDADPAYFQKKYGREKLFYPGLDNSACYPMVIEGMKERFSQTIIEKIAFQNARKFIEKSVS